MNIFTKISITIALATAFSVASSQDFFFSYTKNSTDLCLAEKNTYSQSCTDIDGTIRTSADILPSIARMRILNIQSDDQNRPYIERPFFIIDGIYLDPNSERTLSQLENETAEFNIPNILISLGYTPILIQFSQTVTVSLEENSQTFANILKYLNFERVIRIANKTQDGYVVLGISQGGVIGRYGAYLYDINRGSTQAPIRFFSSLDSPHQGAVIPRSIIATIEFWAKKAGIASAEAFYNLITSPGAKDLLIYETNTTNHAVNTSSDRFLFGDYRKAAEYKGFPQVLISQGQLKGSDPSHATTYYNLNRRAAKLSVIVGRATSKIGYSSTNSEISSNRVYKASSYDKSQSFKGASTYDFIQGSTYPFPQTMFNSLHQGILDAIPGGMKTKISIGFISKTISLDTKWEGNNLYQTSSTFIPTASAMDLKCNNDLAIRSNCAHSVNSINFPFENPGTQSSAKAVYAVDPTHPRYAEPISGRHIESPIKNSQIAENVMNGMQTDVWRIFCELAKTDYNYTKKEFRNPKLNGFFLPGTSCMDLSKMPDLIKNGGFIQSKTFAFARYDYNPDGNEFTDGAYFDIPAGWLKVATFDNGEQIAPGSIFEIDIEVLENKSNWLKAELLITPEKDGGRQLQLAEKIIPYNSSKYTLRWQMPSSKDALLNYRWFRLVLNSNGGRFFLSKPRLITGKVITVIPEEIKSNMIYPNNNYSIVPWSDNQTIKETNVNNASILEASTQNAFDGFHINLGQMYSLDKYKELKIVFVPGTCQKTSIYFDSRSNGKRNLVNNLKQNEFAYKILPLSELIDTSITPMQSLSASRLVIQAMNNTEKCLIQSISLQ